METRCSRWGFQSPPSLGSYNKETLTSRGLHPPTWKPSPGTLGHGEGNTESHGSWPSARRCQPSSRRRSGPAPGRHAPSLPGGHPPATSSRGSALETQSVRLAPGGRRSFPSPAFLSLRSPAVSVPGSPARRRPPRGSRLHCCCVCLRLTPPLPASPASLAGIKPRLSSRWGRGIQVLPGLALSYKTRINSACQARMAGAHLVSCSLDFPNL